MCHQITIKLQLDLSPVAYLSKAGEKELQKIQSYLASLNFSYPECSIKSAPYLADNGKTPAFGFGLTQTKLSPTGWTYTKFFSNFSTQIQKNSLQPYPSGLITVSHDRRFLKKSVRSSIDWQNMVWK